MIRFLLAIILLTIPAGSAAAQASGGEKIKQNLHDCLAGFDGCDRSLLSPDHLQRRKRDKVPP